MAMIIGQPIIDVTNVGLEDLWLALDDTRGGSGETGNPGDPPAFTKRIQGTVLAGLLGAGVDPAGLEVVQDVDSIDLAVTGTPAVQILPALAPAVDPQHIPGRTGPVTPTDKFRLDNAWTFVNTSISATSIHLWKDNSASGSLSGIIPQVDYNNPGIVPTLPTMEAALPIRFRNRLDPDALNWLVGFHSDVNSQNAGAADTTSKLHAVRPDQWITVTAHGLSLTNDVGKPVVIYQTSPANTPGAVVLNSSQPGDTAAQRNLQFPTGIVKLLPDVNTIVLARPGEIIRVREALLLGGNFLNYNVATNGRWLFWNSGTNQYVPSRPVGSNAFLPEMLEMLYINYTDGVFLARVLGYPPAIQVS